MALTIYISIYLASPSPCLPGLPVGPEPLVVQVQRTVRLLLLGTDEVYYGLLAYSLYLGNVPDLLDDFQL
jgi:hypothetical protein